MAKPMIQSLWIGDRLSTLERLSIASFLHHEHEFHLYTYEDVSNVPKGTQLKDANEIIPDKEMFTYCNGSYAGFSNWFRWSLLHKKGNFWVDLDTICLRPYIFDEDIIFGYQSIDKVAVGTLKFPAGHEFCKLFENICNHPHSFLPYDSRRQKLLKIKNRLLNPDRSNIAWSQTGPKGFTKAIKHFGLLDLAKPFTYFYPVHYSRWNSVFNETLADDVDLFKNTYSIHLWNEMIRRRRNIDKNGSFPNNSLFEILKRRYLPLTDSKGSGLKRG